MSYDGPGQHDWLRGVAGAEAAVNRAFELCREFGFPTGAEMCLHDGNKHLLRESVNHLAELGCSSLKTNPIENIGAWLEGGYGASVPIPELLQIYLDYVPLYYEDGMPLSLALGGYFSARPSDPERWHIPAYHSPKDPRRCCVCNHARHVMYLSPEGRTLPCMALSGMDIQEEFPLISEIRALKPVSSNLPNWSPCALNMTLLSHHTLVNSIGKTFMRDNCSRVA